MNDKSDKMMAASKKQIDALVPIVKEAQKSFTSQQDAASMGAALISLGVQAMHSAGVDREHVIALTEGSVETMFGTESKIIFN